MIGSQDLSAVFVKSEDERNTIKKLISLLDENGFVVATKILDIHEFYKANEGHQNYYNKKGSRPYCHGYKKRF